MSPPSASNTAMRTTTICSSKGLTAKDRAHRFTLDPEFSTHPTYCLKAYQTSATTASTCMPGRNLPRSQPKNIVFCLRSDQNQPKPTANDILKPVGYGWFWSVLVGFGYQVPQKGRFSDPFRPVESSCRPNPELSRVAFPSDHALRLCGLEPLR
jgi:hypothetical protein